MLSIATAHFMARQVRQNPDLVRARNAQRRRR
jgi:hypothetical protein